MLTDCNDIWWECTRLYLQQIHATREANAH